MEQRHVANISTLIHFMEALNDPKFTMGSFKHSCGSPACALGWACNVPALADAGLDFARLGRGDGAGGQMAERVFGEYFALFSSRMSGIITTPQAWAEHARSWLRLQGHEVLPPTDDGFKAFMERALKAVALEQNRVA